jgi:hypothetical protein
MARCRWPFGVILIIESPHLPCGASARGRPPCVLCIITYLQLTAVHPLSIRTAGLSSTASSSPVDPRHPRLTVYRCSLPGLTGFAASRRAGPGYQRRLPRAVPTVPEPRAGIRPRYSGLRVQGTASSPSSTTARHPITAPKACVKPRVTLPKVRSSATDSRQARSY